jgi:predicted nucleotidyltransferase
VIAFGSRVKGNAQKYSDLDICIMCDKELSPKVVDELEDEFVESDLPIKVDIVIWGNIADDFRRIVESKNERLFP